MSLGYIDSASIINAVGALVSHSDYDDWSKWTIESITDVTTLLVSHDLLKITPAPSQNPARPHAPSTLYTCYDKALKLFHGKVKGKVIRDDDLYLANANFNNWQVKHVDEIQRAISITTKDDSFEWWINWAVEEAWPDHSSRLDGLFNANMIPLLSHILDISQDELNNLLEKTRDISQVEKWSKGNSDNDDFDLAKKSICCIDNSSRKISRRICRYKEMVQNASPYPEPSY
jgi:hypothetical protein